MVCSTSFDRDDEYFATAGVSRRIKVCSQTEHWTQTVGENVADRSPQEEVVTVRPRDW